MKQSKIYFENLDIMRFVAAYLVLLSHVELTLGLVGMTDGWSNAWKLLESSGEAHLWDAFQGDFRQLFHALSNEMGAMAVVFFFSLSGFLITLLLLKEHDVRGAIDIQRFYVRRVLRIWPLYFLIVLLGLYVLPQLGDAFYVPSQSPNLKVDWKILDLPYLLILPNLSNGLMLGGFPPNIGQAWSIGVEEQFYLFWPWLFLFVRTRPRGLVAFIFLLIAMKALCLEMGWPRWVQVLMTTLKFESMAIGGLGAFLYFKHFSAFKQVGSYAWRMIGAFGILGVIVSFWLCPLALQDGLFIVQSVLFLMVILAGVMVQNRMPNGLKKGLIWLGQRSYGIYMWHMMFLSLSANCLRRIPGMEGNKAVVPLVIMSTILTLVFSHCSYKWLELPFLKMKKRFG